MLELIRTCSEGVTSAEVMYSLGMSRSTVFLFWTVWCKDNHIPPTTKQDEIPRRILFPNGRVGGEVFRKKIPMSKCESFSTLPAPQQNYMITLLLRSATTTGKRKTNE